MFFSPHRVIRDFCGRVQSLLWNTHFAAQFIYGCMDCNTLNTTDTWLQYAAATQHRCATLPLAARNLWCADSTAPILRTYPLWRSCPILRARGETRYVNVYTCTHIRTHINTHSRIRTYAPTCIQCVCTLFVARVQCWGQGARPAIFVYTRNIRVYTKYSYFVYTREYTNISCNVEGKGQDPQYSCIHEYLRVCIHIYKHAYARIHAHTHVMGCTHTRDGVYTYAGWGVFLMIVSDFGGVCGDGVWSWECLWWWCLELGCFWMGCFGWLCLILKERDVTRYIHGLDTHTRTHTHTHTHICALFVAIVYTCSIQCIIMSHRCDMHICIHWICVKWCTVCMRRILTCVECVHV